MGIEKLWTKSRRDRLIDPDIQLALDREKHRMKDSLRNLGNQAKETCTAIPYNTLVRPFVRINSGGKKEFDPAKQILAGSADSTLKTVQLVGRVLMTTGRATKYGVRRTLVI